MVARKPAMNPRTMRRMWLPPLIAHSLCKKRGKQVVDRRVVVGQQGPTAAAESVIDIALRDAERALGKMKTEVSGDDHERRLGIARVTFALGEHRHILAAEHVLHGAQVGREKISAWNIVDHVRRDETSGQKMLLLQLDEFSCREVVRNRDV